MALREDSAKSEETSAPRSSRERASRRSSEELPAEELRLRRVVAAVDSRLHAAAALAAGDQLAAAWVVLRDAAIVAARGLVPGEPSAAASRFDWEIVERAIQDIEARGVAAPLGWPKVRALLADENPIVFDELSRARALVLRAEAENVVVWLRERLQARSVGDFRLRRGVVLGVIGAAVFLGVAMGVYKFAANWGEKNIALGKAVQISSQRPRCSPAAGDTGLPAAAVVDGHKDGAFDICTKQESSPWIMVDLGEVQPLRRAKIYNRNDCCWGQFDLPAVVELSTDGKTFAEVGRQTKAYGASGPWIVSLDDRRARYVRVRVDSIEPKELVLSEIEIFTR